jgi:hypothetical protein
MLLSLGFANKNWSMVGIANSVQYFSAGMAKKFSCWAKMLPK